MRNDGDLIDELIDDAARRIVAKEPSSRLRRAVRERIGHRSSSWMSLPALAGAGALVVVALLVGRTLSGPAGAPDGSDERPTQGPPAIQRAATPGERLARRLAADVAAPVPEEEPVIPPLVIEPLTTTQIAVDVRSGVMPIEIEPLQIEPLQSE